MERRYYEQEIRLAKPESRTVEGYALVFNKESRDLGGFIETIDPGALNGVVEKADVLALLNHSEDRGVLARSTNGKGTLSLSIDNVGLKYSFEAPNTQLGNELLEGIQRGDIRTSSFAFRIAPNGDKWTKRPDGRYDRRITQFADLRDVSPVYREAYPDTTVAKRSMEEIEKAAKAKETEELENYYKNLLIN